MTSVLAGIDPASVRSFERDAMQPDGIVTLDSAFDIEQTTERVLASIESQDDTVVFEVVDQPAGAVLSAGQATPRMVLFGAPGARAMRDAPTLGLDAFCQKFLIWQDSSGAVHLSYNDLGALAERRGVGNSLALRMIDFRLGRTFASALAR